MKQNLEKEGVRHIQNTIHGVNEPAIQMLIDGYFSIFHSKREIRTGDGFIDFFIYNFPEQPVLIETKLSTNKNWLFGISQQLPTYLDREYKDPDAVKFGFYILFYLETQPSLSEMEQEIRAVKGHLFESHKIVEYFVVDLRDRPVPSRRHRITPNTK